MADIEEGSITSDYYNFGGLDHITSPLLLAETKDNKLVQSVNLTSTGVVGGKTSRPSYATFLNNPDSNKVRNIIPFTKQNGDGTTTSYLIRISGNNAYLYQIGSGATTWGAALGSFTCTNTIQPFAWAVLGNLLHLSNGTDAYQTFNGTIFSADTSAPKARTLTTFQRRIFASNTPGNTSREYFSSVGYIGAPGENAPLASAYGVGVTSIQINASSAGTNPFASSNTIGSTYWPAILGSGTANQENVIVTGVSGSSAPYTLTLQAATTKSHASGDIVVNNAAWFSDNANASTANYFDVDPEKNGAVVFNDVVNSNLVMHKASGALYLYTGQSISNPLQSANPFYASPGNSTTSPFAPDQISGIEIYPTRDGVYAYVGGFPTILSNEIYDFIQNMPAANYSTAPGIAFNKKWYYAIGTTKDAFGNTVTNAVLVYDYTLNIWDIYSLANLPTCFGQYIDNNGNMQLVFGDAAGNTYLWGSGSGDNGVAFQSILQTQYLTWGAPEKTKGIDNYMISTNPGSNFQLQYATDWSNQWQTFCTTSGIGISDEAPDGMNNFKSIAFRLISNSLVPMTFYGMTLKVVVGSKRVSGRRL